MKIEGLHNHTGRWVEIADDIGSVDFDEAQEQVQEFAKGCKSVFFLWGVPVVAEHFSAFRING